MLTQDMALLLYIIRITTSYRILEWLHNTFYPPPCQEKTVIIIEEKQGHLPPPQRNWKKDVKKCWQGRRGVVLYLSAKRWGKRMTSEASAGSLWKEPIDAENNSWRWEVESDPCSESSKDSEKKELDKKPLRWYNKQVVSRKAKAHRTLKIEQYRKTCKEPLCVWKNT